MTKKWMNFVLIICGCGSLLASCADSGNIPFNPGPFEKEAEKAVHND
jgi:hypothetical protein